MKKQIVFFLAAVLFSSHAYAKIVSETIDYFSQSEPMQGVIYYNDALENPRGGILIMHEWKGLGDYTKKRAEMLAELGYVAFAADMYGKGIFAKNHEEAGKLAGVYFKDRELMRRRAISAYNAFLLTRKFNPEKMAAIGYCFGGTVVLELARKGLLLKGVASFHGSLATPTPAFKGGFHPQVLVLNGAADKMTSAEDIRNFKAEMEQAEIPYQIHQFEGAMHSFTVWDANDPQRGVQYNEKADKESWEILKNFLEEIFEDKNKVRKVNPSDA